MAQVLETINHHCGILRAFEHWQQTHIRQAISHPALLAGIIGLGCGIGVRKMARISSRVTENELEYAVNWRFSLDNIRAANDAEEAREHLRRLVSTHSPISWAHINMLGEYDFSDEKLCDSVGILPLKSAA